jgi:hypothetical protein
MSRFMEIPVGGPLESIARRSNTAFMAIGRVESFDASSEIVGTIRSGRDSARVIVRWKARGEGFLLDIEADSSDRLSHAADRAIYAFAGEYKDVLLAEHQETEGVEDENLPWFSPRRWLRGRS